MFVWKKTFEKAYNIEAQFEKRRCISYHSWSMLAITQIKKNDIFELLKLIRGFCCKHNQNNDKVYALMNSLRALFINFQKLDMRNDYLKKFPEPVAMLDDYNANVLDILSCLLKDEKKKSITRR